MEKDFKNDEEYRKGIEKVKDLVYDEELGLLYDYEEAMKEKMEDREALIIEEMQVKVEEGIKEGIQQGIEQGIEQGMQKGLEKIINALYQSGMSAEEIANRVNINVEEVNECIK